MKKEKPVIDPSEDRALPANRWVLLKDTLHYRFWDLVAVSLLTALFYIPIIAWLLFAALTNLGDASNFNNILMTYLIAIPLIAFAGLGMGGLFYFSKKLAWGSGASLPSDFFEGIKKNWAMFLGTYFVIGLLYFLLKIDLEALALSSSLPAWGKAMLSGLSYGIFTLFLMALFFIQTQTVTYEGGFFRLLMNGIRFTFGAILKNLAIFAALLAPFFVYEFVPSLYAVIIPIAFLALFYFGFSGFFFTEYSHSLFDISINPKQYPEIIRKGLAPTHESHSDHLD
ncbi:MAG: hypothetical protein BWY98_00111 [Tenericutes bacterium ADurb.BinA155]|nr:MAG: hypothetical protein BWY98_00111 [Tenericutes bacterium ADurb.BinA155]